MTGEICPTINFLGMLHLKDFFWGFYEDSSQDQVNMTKNELEYDQNFFYNYNCERSFLGTF